jgi:hypothetical protein
MIANASSSLRDLWELGSPLDHAWFHFASEEMKAQYRLARDHQQTSALQALMEGEVRQMLANGELRAIGIALPFKTDSAPEEIPALLFAALNTAMDWVQSTIAGLGCSFEEVRVVRASKLANALSTAPIQAVESVKPKGKGGRKDTYWYSARVLQILHQAEAKRHLSAEKLHPAFKAEFERQFPLAEYHIPAPSIRKLRDQLKRFRQESAETSNNQTTS